MSRILHQVTDPIGHLGERRESAEQQGRMSSTMKNTIYYEGCVAAYSAAIEIVDAWQRSQATGAPVPMRGVTEILAENAEQREREESDEAHT